MKTDTDQAAVFDRNTLEYDHWFERYANLYQSELLALEQALPRNKEGIEIGVGTGRFAQPLNVKHGMEVSGNMARCAEKREIKVSRAYAENLPIESG